MAIGGRVEVAPGTFDELERSRKLFPSVFPTGTFTDHEVVISTGLGEENEPILIQTADVNVLRRRLRTVTWMVYPDDTAEISSSKSARLGRPFNQRDRNVRPPKIATLLADLRHTAARYQHIQDSPI